MLAQQSWSQYKPSAPRQTAVCLVKNPRAHSEVSARCDGKRERRQKKQNAPWPQQRRRAGERHRADCIIKTDPPVRDNRRVRRLGFANEIKTVSRQRETGDDI